MDRNGAPRAAETGYRLAGILTFHSWAPPTRPKRFGWFVLGAISHRVHHQPKNHLPLQITINMTKTKRLLTNT